MIILCALYSQPLASTYIYNSINIIMLKFFYCPNISFHLSIVLSTFDFLCDYSIGNYLTVYLIKKFLDPVFCLFKWIFVDDNIWQRAWFNFNFLFYFFKLLEKNHLTTTGDFADDIIILALHQDASNRIQTHLEMLLFWY